MLNLDKVVLADGNARLAGVRVCMKRGGVPTLAPEGDIHERGPRVNTQLSEKLQWL